MLSSSAASEAGGVIEVAATGVSGDVAGSIVGGYDRMHQGRGCCDVGRLRRGACVGRPVRRCVSSSAASTATSLRWPLRVREMIFIEVFWRAFSF